MRDIPRSSMRRSKKRVLSFAPAVEGRKTLHINDYSNEEIKACWYSGEDVVVFRQEAQSTISQMDQGEMLSKEGSRCTRGLEKFTAAGSQWKQDNRDFAISTVLWEQYRQYREGQRDEKLLSRLYSLCTFSCHVMAGMAGHEDAAECGKNLVWLVRE